jgi:hypothetical protein
MSERVKPTRAEVMNRSIFVPNGSKGYSLTAAHHNVRECVWASGDSVLDYVDNYYAGRGLGIGLTGKREWWKRTPKNGLYISTSDKNALEAAKGQVNHLNRLRHKDHPRIKVFDRQALIKAKEKGKVLVVPYLNTSREEEALKELGVEIFGLPGVMTDVLKNKVEAHEEVSEYDSKDFRVVEGYKVIDVNETVPAAQTFLTEIEQEYRDLGLYERYKEKNAIGVVLRAAEADGGYGSCIIFQKNGGWVFTRDGQKGGNQTFTTYEEALQEAQTYLKSTMNEELENRILMSRMIDKVDSPGLSLMIADNHVISLGWNNQSQPDARSACVGTTDYKPKGDYCRQIQQEFEKKTVDEYEKFLRWLATKNATNNVDFSKIRAFVNVDFMIPSELEFTFQEAQATKQGKDFNPYLPIAEFNPRLTDYSDAVVGGPLFFGGLQTPAAMLDLVKNGLHTYLRYTLPQGVDPRAVRDEIGKLQKNRNTNDKNLVVTRMAPKPVEESEDHGEAMSIIIYGDKEKGETTVQRAIAYAGSAN